MFKLAYITQTVY